MSTIIKVIGKDGQGWSIDKDRMHTENAMKELGVNLSNSFLKADIIYCVWYSFLLKPKLWFLRRFKGKRKVVAAVTNDPEENKKNLAAYKKFVDYWVCASQKQRNFLLKNNIEADNIFINPFYVDERVFKPINLSKKELASEFKIDYQFINNQFVIGSFQRDSRGDDLSKSKWHKNPELLIDILKGIDKSKYMLLLAGPRRHFLIKQCRKFDLPYLFVGDEKPIDKGVDDIAENNLSAKEMNLLYNLTDLYLVTSASEGGPKAIIEASLSKTAILSTPVGFAPDLLGEELICNNKEEFLEKINFFMNDEIAKQECIQKNLAHVGKINNFNAYKQRIQSIIESVSNDR